MAEQVTARIGSQGIADAAHHGLEESDAARIMGRSRIEGGKFPGSLPGPCAPLFQRLDVDPTVRTGHDAVAGLLRAGPRRVDHLPRRLGDDRLRFRLEPVQRTGVERAVGGQARGVARDRITGRPVGPGLRVGIALVGPFGIVPAGPRLAAKIEHVVVMGMSADAHRHHLDQGRTQTGSCAFGGPGESDGNRFRIGTVHRQPGDPIALGLVGEGANRRLVADRRRQRRLVVLQAEDGRQPASGREVDRLVPFAEGGAALADERDGDARFLAQREGHRHTGRGDGRDAQRRAGRQDPQSGAPI